VPQQHEKRTGRYYLWAASSLTQPQAKEKHRSEDRPLRRQEKVRQIGTLEGERELRCRRYGEAEICPGANIETELGLDASDTGGNFLAVGLGGIGVMRVPGFVLADEAGKFFAEKWQELSGG